jgi:Fe-S cluster biosynthesis and repair protein YggX
MRAAARPDGCEGEIMTKRSTNFGGKRTWAKGFSTQNLLATMRALGMSDEEIRKTLLEMKEKQQGAQQVQAGDTTPQEPKP